MLEFEYTLKQPVEYQSQGEHVTGDKIIVSAPNYSNRIEAAQLEQFITKAIEERQRLDTSESKNDKEDSNENLTEHEEREEQAKLIKTILLVSSANYESILSIFEKIIVSGSMKFTDGTKINQQIVQKFSYNDINDLLGKYVAFFLL